MKGEGKLDSAFAFFPRDVSNSSPSLEYICTNPLARSAKKIYSTLTTNPHEASAPNKIFLPGNWEVKIVAQAISRMEAPMK